MPGLECHCAPQTRNLEKEKTFAARGSEFIGQFWNMWQVASLECGHRIINEQGTSLVLSKLFTHYIECRLKLERPATRVVGVAGHNVNQSVGHPSQRIFLRARAKNSCDRSSSHLYKTSEPDPFRKPFRLQAQDGIALRMRYDRPQSQKLYLMQRLVHCRWNGIFVEFDEEVITLVDAEARRILAQRVKILGI